MNHSTINTAVFTGSVLYSLSLEIEVIKTDLYERAASKSQVVDLEDDINDKIMELMKRVSNRYY